MEAGGAICICCIGFFACLSCRLATKQAQTRVYHTIECQYWCRLAAAGGVGAAAAMGVGFSAVTAFADAQAKVDYAKVKDAVVKILDEENYDDGSIGPVLGMCVRGSREWEHNNVCDGCVFSRMALSISLYPFCLCLWSQAHV